MSQNKTTLKDEIIALHCTVKADILELLEQSHRLAAHHVRWATEYLEGINIFVHCSSVIACASVGGEITKTIPLVTSWYLFIMAADVYDDIQDGETDKYGGADDEILSFALFLVALSYQTLCQLDVPLETYRRIEGKMRSAYLSAAGGQLRNQTLVFDDKAQQQYLANVIETSATPLGQYYACGTYFAPNVDQQVENAFHEYGVSLATFSQLKDDLSDLQADLRSGSYTLPILHGLAQRDHSLFQELQNLIGQRTKTDSEVARTIEILNRMGSVENVQRLMVVYLQKAGDAIRPVSHLLSPDAAELLAWQNK